RRVQPRQGACRAAKAPRPRRGHRAGVAGTGGPARFGRGRGRTRFSPAAGGRHARPAAAPLQGGDADAAPRRHELRGDRRATGSVHAHGQEIRRQGAGAVPPRPGPVRVAVMRTPDEQLHALIAEQAAEWYVAHRDGELAPSQQQVFMRWLRASPAHVAEYLAIAGMARDIGDAARQNTTPLQPLLREAGVSDRVVSFDGTAYTSARDAHAPGKYRRRAGRDHRASRVPRRPFARWGV